MGTGSGKIILDADASKVVNEAKKGGDAFRAAAKEAAGLGGQIDKYGTQLAKTVVSVGSVAKAIASVTQEIVNAQRAAAEASRKTGGAALSAAEAGARLGLTGSDSKALTAAGGGRSREDLIGLLEALASAKGPGGASISRTNAFQAANNFRSGATREEAIEAAKAGTGTALLKTVNQRNALLGDEAIGERDLRAQEIAAGEQAADIRAGRNGARNRRAQVARDLRNARSPVAGGLQSAVGAATSIVGGDSAIEAADILILGAKLDEQTAIMRGQANRPALAPSPNKQ